ncbi:MAG: RNA polymerase sigma factor [Solirubrobacterales bacterium]
MGVTTASARVADDERLVDGVRAGDDDAFAEIYDRHAGELLGFCRHMLGSGHDAEDALQQAMMKAYRSLRRTDSEIAIRPWLYTIARNECLTVIRRRRETATDPVALESTTQALTSEVEAREELKSMLSDISRLPAEQRAALLHSSLGSASGEEIARALDTDRDRVKALVFRARHSLTQSREARETSCVDIRSQLSELRGGSLRRKVLREHLVGCEGCREYRQRVREARRESVPLVAA